jgi:hypothetical protein
MNRGWHKPNVFLIWKTGYFRAGFLPLLRRLGSSRRFGSSRGGIADGDDAAEKGRFGTRSCGLSAALDAASSVSAELASAALASATLVAGVTSPDADGDPDDVDPASLGAARTAAAS